MHLSLSTLFSAAGGAAPAFGQFGTSFAFTQGVKTEQPSVPTVFGGLVATEPASSTLAFGDAGKISRTDLPGEVPPETGEEAESTVFSGSGILFEFDHHKQWRERGRGEMRVNVDEASGLARMVMRQKGNLRLLLNANLWAEMQLTVMEGGSVSSCIFSRLCICSV
jgi:Ran-binding protein 3